MNIIHLPSRKKLPTNSEDVLCLKASSYSFLSLLFFQALRVSNTLRKELTLGEIVNLMAVDAQRFTELMAYINLVWAAPLQIALAMYFLYETLGNT